MIGPGTQIHHSTTMAEDAAMMVHARLVARSTEIIAVGEEMRIFRVGLENTRVGKDKG